jgi:hypothetical protein
LKSPLGKNAAEAIKNAENAALEVENAAKNAARLKKSFPLL